MSSTQYNYSNDFSAITGDMKLEDANIVKFKIAKEFCENKARINSIDFSQDGKNLVTSSDDDTIVLYDCEKGIKKSTIMSKKYGVDLIRYTHAMNTVIHTSTKENDTIRYLSLHDNKYIRYFVGHEKRVVTLSMSPADDTFLSGSIDQTIRIWNLKQDKPLAKISTGLSEGVPVANFDPEGLIFAVGLNSEVIKLYDSRLYEKGPFNTIKQGAPPAGLMWKSLKFSPNGKQILITTNMEELYILDAFSGQPLHKLTLGPPPTTPIEHPCEAAYSPDSQYILCGALDGSIHVWSATKGIKLTILKPIRSPAEPVQCVAFDPKFMLIASACSRVSLWIPTSETPRE